MKRGCIGIFCGASIGNRRMYAVMAQQIGRMIAEMEYSLICGGSRLGLMGALADAVLEAGGEVHGVMPRALINRHVAHPGLTSLLIVETVEDRKRILHQYSDAFLALPGSFATFEDLFDILRRAQLGMHAKPCGLLNTAGFYDPLILQINRAISDGFLKPAYRNLLMVETNPEKLLFQLTDQRLAVSASSR